MESDLDPSFRDFDLDVNDGRLCYRKNVRLVRSRIMRFTITIICDVYKRSKIATVRINSLRVLSTTRA